MRDHVDMVLSFNHQPTLVINDVPGMTAKHGNKRKENMFSPHEGRFEAPTEENLTKLKNKELTVDLPFFAEPNTGAQCQVSDDHSYLANVHPVTLTADHYIAADSFHKNNTKKEAEKLRDTSLVQQLAGKLNTQVCEQLFSFIKTNLYFLNAMSPQRYLLVLRLILHLRNKGITDGQMRDMERTCLLTAPHSKVTVGSDGRMVVVNDLTPSQDSIPQRTIPSAIPKGGSKGTEPRPTPQGSSQDTPQLPQSSSQNIPPCKTFGQKPKGAILEGDLVSLPWRDGNLCYLASAFLLLQRNPCVLKLLRRTWPDGTVLATLRDLLEKVKVC